MSELRRGSGLGEHLVSLCHRNEASLAGLRSRDGPVVLGTGDQVLESQASASEDKGIKGPSKLPKVMMKLGLQWCSPTVFMSWHTEKMIILY